MDTKAVSPMTAKANAPEVVGFFHEPTNTITYLVIDPATRHAAVIDPVLDYDAAAAKTGTASADALLKEISGRNLTIEWIIETHIHADHLSAGHYLKTRLDAPIAVGNKISTVQETFQPIFNLPYPFAPDGRQFDKLFEDGESFSIGQLTATVMATPGHTPACMSYLVGDALFVGDTLFMPDYGTARCDFPGGNAETLYKSIQKLLSLPGETRMFLCHDYPPDDRPPAWETTVAEQKEKNVHIAGKSKAGFTALRNKRDAGLKMPALILPSIQLNMRAGELPPEEDNGTAYLKIPLNRF